MEQLTPRDQGTKPPSKDSDLCNQTPGEVSAQTPQTRSKRGTPRPPVQGRSSTPRQVSQGKKGGSPRSSARCMSSTDRPTTRGKDSTPRPTTRPKGETSNTTGALDATCLGTEDSSVTKGATEAPCLIEVSSSVAPYPSEVGSLVTSCLDEVAASVAPCLGEIGVAVAPCTSDVGVLAESCPNEVGASVAPCIDEIGTSRAPAPGETGSSFAQSKQASLVALSERAASEAPVLDDGGFLVALVPEAGARSESSNCTLVGQTTSKSGTTTDLSSVEIFNSTVDSFLEKLVEAGSYKRFAKCYEPVSKIQPEITKSIYLPFIYQLRTLFKDDVKEIKEEGKLEALLDSLDKIKDEAKSRVDPAWRPSGIPEEDVQSPLVPYYLQQKKYMQKLLKEKESENAKLAESVLGGRKQIAALQQQIQKRKEAWQAIGKAQTELVMSLQEITSEILGGNH